MIEAGHQMAAVPLAAGSEGLAVEIARAADGLDGRVIALDVTAPAPSDPWTAFVADPGAALMATFDEDERLGIAPRTLVVVRIPGDPAGDPTGVVDATVEMVRGIVGCVVLDRAGAGFRANVVVANAETSTNDLHDAARHLMDPAVSGFSDGVTLRLTSGAGARARPPGAGRRALVVGAAGGMGLAVSRRFREDGYDVVMSDVDADRLRAAADELGGMPVPGDVTDVERLVADVGQHVADGLDALLVCHGVDVPGDLGDLDRARYARGFDINATAPVRIVDAFRPHLRRRAPSNVAIIASAQGLVTECCGVAGYTASKFALVGFATGQAATLRIDHIAINLLCPGWVETPFHDDDIEGARKSGAGTPVGRIGTADEMAEAMFLLGTIDATGVVYAPTGGLARI